MNDSLTPSLQQILSQVPQPVRDSGTPRQRLEAVWRIMGWGRSGLQTRVAGELAERWHRRGETPLMPADDPRKAGRKLDRIMSGELSMPLDLAFELIDCLPEPYRAAARSLIYPTPVCQGRALDGALGDNARLDNVTDAHRFRLARHAGELSRHELVAIAQAYQAEAASCSELADALLAAAEDGRAAV